MNYFRLNNKVWMVEEVPLQSIAKKIGTPCYVYSKAAIYDNWYSFNNAFRKYPHQINYAVKANSNLAILNALVQLNSGFDIVSLGELERVLKARGDPKKVVFSGAGKTSKELLKALEVEIGCINVESKEELLNINNIAISSGKKVNIAIRVNPDVNSNSHYYIATGHKETKFGVNIKDAKEFFELTNKLPGIKVQGIAFHLGSQMTSLVPVLTAIDKILELIKELASVNIKITHINVGGGLGVTYKNEVVPTPQEYVNALLLKLQTTNLIINIEPGRALVANTGVLLTKIEYIKQQHTNNNSTKYFAIVDAAMNDLLRPALYGAWHNIVSLNTTAKVAHQNYDVVGPVCETADFLGKNRPLAIEVNDVLMICSVGAYGFSMSSNYNSRPRAAEVMVDGNKFYIVRKREKVTDLFKLEKMLP